MAHRRGRARFAHLQGPGRAAGLRAHLADPWTDRFGQAICFEDFIDCGDWVVAPWRGRLHGHGSGIEIEVSETYAVLVREGRIVRVDEYRTVDDALAAVEPHQK